MILLHLTFFMIGLIVGGLLAILIMSLAFSLEIQWREIEVPCDSCDGAGTIGDRICYTCGGPGYDLADN